MLNLSSILTYHAKNKGDKPAFIFGEKQYTFAEMDVITNKVANALVNLGVKPGDKVALSCPNTPHFPIAYYGILKTGAAVVPLSILLKHDEVAYHLTDSEAVVYLCFEGSEALPMGVEGYNGFQMVDSCKHMVVLTGDLTAASPFEGTLSIGQVLHSAAPTFTAYATMADDTAVVIYTSGTTGKPKGAELSHSNLSWNAKVSQELFNMQQGDVTLTVLPLFHIFGQTCLMNASMFMGIPNVLMARFDAVETLKLFRQNRVTVFAGVPTMYWGLVNLEESKTNGELVAYASRQIRLMVSGGSSLPVQILEDVKKKYGQDIYEGYGMSEGSPVVTFNHPGTVPVPGSIGTPIWGVFVKLLREDGTEAEVNEPGELCYRGHSLMKGYYNKPDATADSFTEDGWFKSGDIAKMDENGYYYIVDRSKDLIIRGGLNVYPREVEEAMMKHPKVSMVAVIGVPNVKMGEEIKAFVILKDGQEMDSEDLKVWTKQHLADYKYPRIIEFVKSLPMSASGKILKRELRLMSE